MAGGTQDFTGSNGSGAPTGFSAYTPAGTQNIQTNQWRQVSGGGYIGTALSRTTTMTDTDITVTVTLGAETDSYPLIAVRTSGGTNGWDATYCEVYTGYSFEMNQSGDIVYLKHTTAGSSTAQTGNVSTGALSAPGAVIKMRLQAIGTAVKGKIWDASGGEPGTWTIETTFTGITSGYQGFRQQCNITSQTVNWDDFVWDDGASGVTLPIDDAAVSVTAYGMTVSGGASTATLQAATVSATAGAQVKRAIDPTPTTIGTNTATAAATTTTIVKSAAPYPAVGDLVLAYISRDNITNDPATGDSLSDGLGNTYTRATAICQPAGTSTAGVGQVGAFFYSFLDVAWSGTVTLTYTHPSVGSRAVAAEFWAGFGDQLAISATSAGNAAGSPTVTSGTAATDDYVIGVCFYENSGTQTETADTDTSNGSWSAVGLRTFSGSSGTAATARTFSKLIRQYKNVTGSGTQTYNALNSNTASVTCGALIAIFRHAYTASVHGVWVPLTANPLTVSAAPPPSTANLGSATVTIAANNPTAPLTTAFSATVTATAAGTDVAGTRTAATAAATTAARPLTNPFTTTTAAAATVAANNAGGTRVSTAATSVGVTAYGLTASSPVSRTLGTATVGVAAQSETGPGRTEGAGAVAATAGGLTASVPVSVTIGTATVAVSAAGLTAGERAVIIGVLGYLLDDDGNIVTDEDGTPLVADGFIDPVVTLAAANLAQGRAAAAATTTTVQASNLGVGAITYTANLGSATVAVAASNLRAQSGATLATATVGVAASGVTGPSRSATAATVTVAAGSLTAQVSFSATLAAAAVAVSAGGLTSTFRAVGAATATTAATNLSSQVPGSATLAAAAVGVSAFGLTVFAPGSSIAQAAAVAVSASVLGAQNSADPVAANVAVAAFNPVALTPYSATTIAAPVGVTAFGLTTQVLVSGVANAASVAVSASSLAGTRTPATAATTATAFKVQAAAQPTSATVAATAFDIRASSGATAVTATVAVSASSATGRTALAAASTVTAFNIGARIGATVATATVAVDTGWLSQFSPSAIPLGTTTAPTTAFKLAPTGAAAAQAAVATEAQPLVPRPGGVPAPASVAVAAFNLTVSGATLRPASALLVAYDPDRIATTALVGTSIGVTAYPLTRGIPLGTATVSTEAFTPVVELIFGIVQFFDYARFLEHIRATVATATGRAAYLSGVTEGDVPEEPFAVIHAFGPTGTRERALDGSVTAISFYIQVDGIGRGYKDALWVLDRSVRSIRLMECPSNVNDVLVRARSSAFEINSEALRAVGQRLAVTATRVSP